MTIVRVTDDTTVVRWSQLDGKASVTTWSPHQRAWTTQTFSSQDNQLWSAASEALRSARR